MYFVCKNISNLLACVLLPIKMEELGACKRQEKRLQNTNLNWLLKKKKNFIYLKKKKIS